MAGVIFPERAVVQLTRPSGDPLHLPGALFFVRLCAAQKNDYQLGPFVSDRYGRVIIDRERCGRFVEAEHDSGLMDYAGIGQCSTEVEIRLASPAEIGRATRARSTVWRRLLRGEAEIFGSIETLIAAYKDAPNHQLRGAQKLRVIWDGSNDTPSYIYPVDDVAPT